MEVESVGVMYLILARQFELVRQVSSYRGHCHGVIPESMISQVVLKDHLAW